jgi:hypothetical protein
MTTAENPKAYLPRDPATNPTGTGHRCGTLTDYHQAPEVGRRHASPIARRVVAPSRHRINTDHVIASSLTIYRHHLSRHH